MRLRLFARFRRPLWQRPGRRARRWLWAAAWRDQPDPSIAPQGRHRRGERPPIVTVAPRGGAGQQPPPGGAPFASPVAGTRARPGRPARGDAARRGSGHRAGAARAAVRPRPGAAADSRAAREAARSIRARAAAQARPPWYEVAHPRRAVEGRRDCGALERVLHREWEEGLLPPPEVVRAIDRLAELPARVAERLADGLEAIYVGPGGVPDLDNM